LAGVSSKRAWADLRATASDSRVWRALAMADIRSKYRLSTFGTLWITLSTGVMAISIGLIYGQFFGQNLDTYLPYFVTGMVIWTFIASVTNEATHALIGSGTWIKGSSLPISFYVMRMLQRNFIILLHNFIIVVLVWLYFRWNIPVAALLSLLGLAIVYVFLAGAAIVISFLCVRYRDIPPMIGAVTQFVFFASPIMWSPDKLKVGLWLVTLNPVAYLIAVARDPLLGRPVPLTVWLIAIGLAAASVGLAALVYTRYRNRIAYWV
jgi:ABC-type polysaccharide/polyol phosphate export permease